MPQKSVVHYTLKRCIKCMKCIKACPTSALSMVDNAVQIDSNRCINCGRCIQSCHNRGILAHGSTLDSIEEYDYTICMVPSALIYHCKNVEEVEELFYAIKQLGFDEVVDITAYSARQLQEAQLMADSAGDTTFVSSFCPVVNRLIANRYKVLQESILPINYDSEIAAKDLRRQYPDVNLGIFHICECEAKLQLAKYPFGGDDYECDHALALVDIFPKIQKNLHKGKLPVSLCKEGLRVCNPNRILQKDTYLIADGFDKVESVLDMSEFGLLNNFNLLMLYPCYNGCIGGHMLFGNSFTVTNHLDDLIEAKDKEVSDVPFDYVYTENFLKTDEDTRSFIERTNFYKKVNEALDHLPGYDCSACGMQTCRIMAEEIVKGNKVEEDCRVLRTLKEK